MTPQENHVDSDVLADSAFSTVEYHEPTDTYRTEFDSETRPPSEAIVHAVATAQSKDPEELPPLFRTFDPETLNDLYTPQSHSTSPIGMEFEFEFAGCEVTVHGHGTVLVTPQQTSPQK